MATKLTESQERNISRLHEIGGTYTLTKCSTIRPPRRDLRYRHEMRQGYRRCYSEKASHKGFHRSALWSLVEKGLVVFTKTERGANFDTEGQAVMNSLEEEIFTFTLA
tara:strand:- start:445 stop:768 length:324 start_codon:yes stop_codon:yes gene_type:complete